jgi:hypothetical protein
MPRSSIAASCLLIVLPLCACSSSQPTSATGDDASTDALPGTDNGDAAGGADQTTPSDDSSASETGTSTTDASPDQTGGVSSVGSDGATDATGDSEPAPDAPASYDAVADQQADSANADGGTDGGGPWVYLFDGNSPGGALGGRSGADALCAASAAALADGGTPLANVHAFLSVSDTDEIRDMPANYGLPTTRPVGSLTGHVLASDWSALLGGSIQQSLGGAGVFVGTFWYSGSNADGSVATVTIDAGADAGGVHPYTCGGWTQPSSFLDGEYGVSGTTTSAWIATSQATCGFSSYHLLCAGWN